ncbi:hypothetical protein ASD30_25205 [Nocardioides sp. Root140]|nr:hypothetical protein ASD30_25205 [Nocardioides sp. Root140]
MRPETPWPTRLEITPAPRKLDLSGEGASDYGKLTADEKAPHEAEALKLLEETQRREAAKAKRAVKRAANHAAHPTWYRRGLTQQDKDFLAFLTQFQYAKAKHLALLHNTSEKNAYRRLKGLQEYGFVTERPLHDTTSLWAPTSKSVKQSPFKGVIPAKAPARAQWARMPHNFVMAYIGAALQGGSLNVLGMTSFEELEATVGSKEYEDAARHNQRVRERNAERLQANGWTIYAEPLITAARRRSHLPESAPYAALAEEVTQVRGKPAVKIPDLVVGRDDFKAAVEVELNWKGKARMEDILQTYRSTSFEKIFYITPDAEDRANLTAMLKHPNWLELRKRFVVMPLLVPAGAGGLEVYKGDSTFLYRL